MTSDMWREYVDTQCEREGLYRVEVEKLIDDLAESERCDRINLEALAECEAAVRSHGYKRDIALDVARKAEAERARLREALKAVTEWWEQTTQHNGPPFPAETVHAALEGRKG